MTGLKALLVAVVVLLGSGMLTASAAIPGGPTSGVGVPALFYVPNPPEHDTITCNNSVSLFTLAVWVQPGAQTVSLHAQAGGTGLVTLQAGGATATAVVTGSQTLVLGVLAPAGDTQVSVTLAGPVCGQGAALTLQDLNLATGP